MQKRDIMVRQVSRTFALSIEQLPPLLRDAVSVAYLMFRIADGIEAMPQQQFEAFEGCSKKAEKARFYIRESRAGR